MMTMPDSPTGHISHTDIIPKAEFIRHFSEEALPGEWFTAAELSVFDFPRNAGSLAARYLIKKRICSETGRDDLATDIEILNDALGKPQLSLGDEIAQELDRKGIRQVLCSISHSRNYITGMTIFCY
jgi:phosphopantetheinyl transferase (holo-ACP synthase)